jgi:CarD family transcriptional regulator
MYRINDYLVFNKNVCKVADIKDNFYILMPVTDASLTIKIPTTNETIRPIITKEELEKVIKKIPDIEIIECSTHLIENEYKKLLKDGSYESLIKIIKTTFLRNQKRLDANKKLGDKDSTYFHLAEKYLYSEFSIALGKTYEETKEYIENRVNAITTK